MWRVHRSTEVSRGDERALVELIDADTVGSVVDRMIERGLQLEPSGRGTGNFEN